MEGKKVISFFGSADKASAAVKEFGGKVSSSAIDRWGEDIPLQWLMLLKEIMLNRVQFIELEIEKSKNGKAMAEKKVSLLLIPPELKIYGDREFRGDCILEGNDQATFFDEIRKTSHGKVATGIKNEGKRTPTQHAFDYGGGLTAGWADIHIVGTPPFYCELKRKNIKKSTTTQEQINFLLEAQKRGAFVCYALGFEAALEAVKDWEKVCERHKQIIEMENGTR